MTRSEARLGDGRPRGRRAGTADLQSVIEDDSIDEAEKAFLAAKPRTPR